MDASFNRCTAVKLSTFTDYSLRVLLFVATRPEHRATIGEIAHAFSISENHLTKVVHFLAKAGWLASVRGRGGGLMLGRPASEIVVGEVVRATEGPSRLAECFEPAANQCCITRVCELRNVLSEAADAFYKVLDSYTLAQLVGDGASLSRVLFMTKKATAP
jgi:Rrf2 family nitric oxide-sensitive transcriptional repressor